MSHPDYQKWLKLEDTLLVILISLLACITMANVLIRYFSTESFAWTEEISIFFLILMTMVGTSSGFIRYQHIRIELVINKCVSKTRHILDWCSSTVCLSFFIIFTILAARMCLDEIEYEDISPAIGVPMWWYSIFIPILSTLISLRLLQQWCSLTFAFFKGDQK